MVNRWYTHMINRWLVGGLKPEIYDFPNQIGDDDPIWQSHIFQRGSNHQLGILSNWLGILTSYRIGQALSKAFSSHWYFMRWLIGFLFNGSVAQLVKNRWTELGYMEDISTLSWVNQWVNPHKTRAFTVVRETTGTQTGVNQVYVSEYISHWVTSKSTKIR